MRRAGILMTGLLVAVYLAMAVFSAVCAIEHDPASPAGHHPPHGSSAHTSFCAWACQANQTIDLLSSVPQGQPLSLIAVLFSMESPAPLLLSQHAASSRAPPQS